LSRLAGRTFYAVGGTWRALAKLQMAERDYPLRVLHDYGLDVADGFGKLVERAAGATGRKAEGVAESRRPLLGLRSARARRDHPDRSACPVSVSALGVREACSMRGWTRPFGRPTRC
jgi:exopolyphosphatase/guanosine-5'-triphosphate,3'-diphosphate pyrophosphatase